MKDLPLSEMSTEEIRHHIYEHRDLLGADLPDEDLNEMIKMLECLGGVAVIGKSFAEAAGVKSDVLMAFARYLGMATEAVHEAEQGPVENIVPAAVLMGMMFGMHWRDRGAA